MKIVVVPGAFKGSSTQIEAAETMKQAIRKMNPKAEVVLKSILSSIYSIVDKNITLQQAMKDAKMLLLRLTSRVYHQWLISQQNKEEFFMVKEVHTKNAPAAIGPYSQAIEAGDYLFVSGQIGVDPKSGEVVEGIENQTKQVLENLKAILTEAGTDFSKVVKFTIYLSSMDDFATVNEIYGSYLQKPFPARATVEVSRLPKDLLVEMDAIVYTK